MLKKRLPVFVDLTTKEVEEKKKKQDAPVLLQNGTQNQHQNQKPPLFSCVIFYLSPEDLMFRYRIDKCATKDCNGHYCFNWHQALEPTQRRRPPNAKTGVFDYFVMQMCPDLPHSCRLGKRCQFVHNYSEKWYHPFMFRRKPCHQLQTRGCCNYGVFCAFRHD